MGESVIRGGTLVTPEGLLRADVAIEGGRIQTIGPELPGSAEEIDAHGLHVFPAVIDVHLHFNEPGRTEWEGAATGSRGVGRGRRNSILRHAAELDALHCQRRRVRSQTRGT